jgi:hypothetical protein
LAPTRRLALWLRGATSSTLLYPFYSFLSNPFTPARAGKRAVSMTHVRKPIVVLASLQAALVVFALACDSTSSDPTRGLPAVSTTVATLDTAASVPSSSQAWWLWARFTPAGDAIEGIPVAQIDPDWIRASMLGRQALPPEALSQPGLLPDSTINFVQDGDFNDDDVADRAIVGVYETRTGTRGSFLLILTRSGGQWQRSFLHKSESKPGFLVLQNDTAGITVWSCMECDSYAQLRWNGKAYELIEEACCDDPTADTATTTLSARWPERRAAIATSTI